MMTYERQSRQIATHRLDGRRCITFNQVYELPARRPAPAPAGLTNASRSLAASQTLSRPTEDTGAPILSVAEHIETKLLNVYFPITVILGEKTWV